MRGFLYYYWRVNLPFDMFSQHLALFNAVSDTGKWLGTPGECRWRWVLMFFATYTLMMNDVGTVGVSAEIEKRRGKMPWLESCGLEACMWARGKERTSGSCRQHAAAGRQQELHACMLVCQSARPSHLHLHTRHHPFPPNEYKQSKSTLRPICL